MKLLAQSLLIATACSMAALAGCTQSDSHDNSAHIVMKASALSNINEAIAVLQPTKGNTASGWVRFTATSAGVHVTGEISNLAPNSEHGFHIHDYGDATSADGTSAGTHYNPEGHAHGGPKAAMHHAGDFGNITADANGVAKIDLTVTNISIAGDMNPILGRGVIVHAKADDLLPTANAGPRIAMGVIGVAKPPVPATAPATMTK